MWSANILVDVREMRDQIPGTTHGRARTKSATNNIQASGYVRACGALEPPQGQRVDMQYEASH